MAIYFAAGTKDTALCDAELRAALDDVWRRLEPRRRVAAVPPDYSRRASRAGDLTAMLYEYYRDRLCDVLPAVGTHEPMPLELRRKMFSTVPDALFRTHDWRRDAETIGLVDADFVAEQTEGLYREAWPVQLNRSLWTGNHDLIVSLGQVVPHEVIGMANYNKNLFVGVGGQRGINESHYVGAVYGMERIMGVGDNPLRRIFNEGQRRFCRELPLLFVLTVIGSDAQGRSCVRGLFVGDDDECFWRACELSAEVNVTRLARPLKRAVVMLDAEKFPSTWLGNKAVYRTRKAMADDGELVILAPGVRTFGEDSQIDALIRQYGYRTTPQVLEFVRRNDDLRQNLSAAAHLIHGSPEERFRVTYCTQHLTADEVRGVGYEWAPYAEMAAKYLAEKPGLGWQQTAEGEEFYFIPDPSLGLWECDGCTA